MSSAQTLWGLKPTKAERVAILRRSVQEWNDWRRGLSTYLPNLDESLLNDTNLGKANLSGLSLKSTFLRNSDLIRADLRGSNLSEADLTGARLDGALLHDAHLIRAKLKGASLVGAGLNGVDLSGACLQNVDFTNAKLVRTDLRGTDLAGAKFTGADLRHANLEGLDLTRTSFAEVDLLGANLRRSNLSNVELIGVDLRHANLSEATMIKTKLSRAQLQDADLSKANLMGADFTEAKLDQANLELAILIGSILSDANLSGCRVYGVSAWDVKLEGTIQRDLIITPFGEESPIRVDELEVAQFIYMLLNRAKLRSVIETLGAKAVLILGRFTERKELLDRMAAELRRLGYLPMIFDFERPTNRDLTETVKILAGLSRFVIADITNPMSVPYELGAIIPDYMVPFVTILERGQRAFGMFDDLPRKFNWALPLLEYRDADSLMQAFEVKLVAPALEKADEVRRQKAAGPVRRSAED